MDAASEVVIVPASDASETATHKPTDTFNVNQSNNNTHTQANLQTGSNSLLSKIASNVIINNSVGSLNIGGSSNSNSSCSSSSTSSNSSGYGSATTTPTNNYDLQNTTPTTTPIPQTTVAHTDHIIPVATVAAVTPFFNEAITTHNLDTQLHHPHHHHAQQSQEQLQEQQNHVLQAHHQQYSQNHLQPNLQHQQHHQYLSRQQYYSPYEYQQSAPTHNLPAPSAAPTVAPYNMIIPAPYEVPASNVSSPAFGNSHYKSASSTQVGPTYERSPSVKINASACTQQSQQQHADQQQPKTVNQLFSGLLGSTKPRSSSSFINNSTSSNTSKPQAAATPFYANPIPFYDNYKHKIPLEYPDTYSNASTTTTATYHQQQKYYAAAKSQLKEASYRSPTGLNSKSVYANTGNVFPSPTSGLNLSSASYDKYMNPHAPTTAYTAAGHLGNETPPEMSNYRKPIMGSNMSSPPWPWGIEYASGNSRSIPPPASHIPTATVAPTHATHLAQTPSVLARDPFYMAHDKYVGKCDKYGTPSYAQTYVSPPTSRHMWSNTPHASNLTQFNERHLLATAPPALPAHGPHTAPYFPNNLNASLNSRQACCSQPYQSQSCYYPVTHPAQPRLSYNQNNTVAPPPPAGCLPAQQTLGQSPHLNALAASCKYGGVFPDYGNANKMKTSNDLYLNSHHYDINQPPHNFGYPTAHNSQQLYNTNQSMAHAVTPTSLLTNDPFNANPTSYTNDLNLTTSNFDNYHAHLDNHPSQQTLTGLHNTQPPPAYGPTVAKRALLDYRKPVQPQPPPTIPDDCYPSLTSRDHYNQHELLNTPETTTTFEEYEAHQSNATNQSAEVLADSIAVAEESNKNLSLRDFIANWNDDEDEYQNNEEINFDETAVINEVLQTAPVEQEAAAAVVTIQEVKVIKPATQTVRDAENPKEAIKTVEDPSGLLNATESSQYVNLPDIVIDVKKSNNVNNSITTPITSPTLSPTQVAVSSLNLTDFDVEKELDELNLKKPLEQELTKELNDTKDSKGVNIPQLSPSKNINSQLSFEDLNLEPPAAKAVLNAIPTRLAAQQGSESNEQYLKDIEGYESGCSHHSNESAFEKEYETFINKITSESSCPTKKGEQKPIQAESEIEFDKNVQDFSKFYKRKRKLKDDELKTSTRANQTKKKIKTNEATKTNNSNFPQVYTKKCRNRFPKIKRGRSHKRKPLSVFYKIIYFIRRHGRQRKKRVHEFMLELKDKHLPLIKRQSIKNFTSDINDSLLVPKTLKALCINVFNTEEFRQKLLLTKDRQPDNCLDTEEKHICTDPTCETCEVIKSLMETENFEASLMQQTSEPAAVYCAEITKEAITILDDIPTTNDFNFHNEPAIVISNSVEDKQYIAENLSELITKSVLADNLVLEQLDIDDNIHAKDHCILQAVIDDFETNFSEADKTQVEVRDIGPQIEQDCEFDKQVLTDTKTDAVIEEIVESKMKSRQPLAQYIIQPVAETSFYENAESKNFPDKCSLSCDFNAVPEILSTGNEPQVQKSSAAVESTENKTSGVEKYVSENCSAEANISFPQKAENFAKATDNEESDTEASSSSSSESESSSSDTEDSYKKRTSNSESSDSDTDSDLEEHETYSVNSTQSRLGEGKSADSEVTQSEENNVSEKKAEQNSSSPPQIQTVGNNRTVFDNEQISRSPQRIVIRITKSLTNSPNEQSLRVENISAQPLKTPNEYDDQAESDEADDEVTKQKKTDFLTTQQEDFVSIKLSEKQTDSDDAEDCSTAKKLVTPLKLVLRGKEYLRVKSIKKTLKFRTKRDTNTESESEEDILKRKSKAMKLASAQEHDYRKDTKRSKLKSRAMSESDSDKNKTLEKLIPEKLEQTFEEIEKKEDFGTNLENVEKSTNRETTVSVEDSHIYESRDERQQECAEVADINTGINSDARPESVADGNATPISFAEEFDQISEEQRKDYLFDAGCENEDYSVATFALNNPLHSSKAEMTSEEHNKRISNSSPKEDHFNEYGLLPVIEFEKADFSEIQDEVVAGSLKKSSSLEVIETYILTDSEQEIEIHSSACSESYNGSDYDDASDDDECLEPTNHRTSNPIVISDDDSLEAAAENNKLKIQSSRKIFKDRDVRSKSRDSELVENTETVNISHIENFEYSRSSTELRDLDIIDATEDEIHHTEPDFSDYSSTSEEDSDEENISSSSAQKPNENEPDENCLLDSSSTSLETTESCKKDGFGTAEEPSPIDGLKKIKDKDNTLELFKCEIYSQPVTYANSEQENSEIAIVLAEEETEKLKSPAEENADFENLRKFTNQARELQKKAEKNKNLNMSEENQSQEENFEEVVREHRLTPNDIQKDYEMCTLEPSVSTAEEGRSTPEVILNEIKQASSAKAIDINTSEATAKDTEIDQNLEENLEEAAESPMQDDDDTSRSSKTCSPEPGVTSYTPQVAFQESLDLKEALCRKTSPSTKTKAAYKAYDLQSVVRMDYPSDSETEKSHSNSQSIEVDSNEIAKDYKTKETSDIKAHKCPLPAPFSAENESKLVLEESESFASKSYQSVVLDEPPEELDIANDIQDTTSNVSPANKVPNEMEEIKELEEDTDKAIIEARGMTPEETKSKSFTPESCIALYSKNSSIEDPVLANENEKEIEIRSNKDDANISSPEATLMLTKEEKTQEISKNSITVKYLHNHTTQTSTSDQDNFKNSNISLEIKDQSDITENESERPHNSSGCENSNGPEIFKSSRTETYSPRNKNAVVEEVSRAEKPEKTNKAHIQEHLESFDLFMLNNISNKLKKELKSAEILQNAEVIHSPVASNEKTTAEDFVGTEEKENKLKDICEAIKLEEEVLETSSELNLTSAERQISEHINSGQIAAVMLENAKDISTIVEPMEQTKDIERSPVLSFEKSDKVDSEDIKSKLKKIEESEGNDTAGISNPSYKSDQISEDSEISEAANTNDKLEEEIKETEPTLKSAKESAERGLKESSIENIEKELVFEEANSTKVTNIEAGKEEQSEAKNKFVENNFKETAITEQDLSFLSAIDHSKVEISKEESDEALTEEEQNNSISMDSTMEKQETVLEECPFDSSRSTYELTPLSKKDSREEINNQTNLDEKNLSVTPESTKTTKQVDLKERSIIFKEEHSLSQVRYDTKDVAKEDGKGEDIEEEEPVSAVANLEIETKDHDSHNELDFTCEVSPNLKEVNEIRRGAVNGEVQVLKMKSESDIDADTELKEFSLQGAQDQNPAAGFQQKESYGDCTKQTGEVSTEVINGKHNNEELDDEEQNLINDQNNSLQEKDEVILDNFEKAKNNEEPLQNVQQILKQNDKQMQPATEESIVEPQNDHLNGSVDAKILNKPCITPDESSVDFYGFKNQSSFEDESEDFHGFEDLEEVARIRQEIENINDDSAANDGFLNNHTLNRAVHKTSTASLTESTTSEINEMEALEKELSQHQLETEVTDEDKELEKDYPIKTIRVVSTNDIEQIKQMLESDEELQNDGEYKLETMAHTCEDKSLENRYIKIPNDRLGSVSSMIPKLSDLCRAALNSSLNSSSNLAQQHTETSAILVEHELSIEEALAEMYRQAGVLLSDSEDCDNDAPPPDDTEAHDVLLINLQEILNSDNNDVYVLQCDMRENVLNAVQSTEKHAEESPVTDAVNTERVNMVQIILDTQNAEPQIHIISSDSESEVIILSDDDSEITYRKFKAREENVVIPFINDEEINNGDENLFDISTIHHEEIVPDNLAKFMRDEFYKYLYEKYVQRRISKYYHAHRILKKYKRRFIRRQ